MAVQATSIISVMVLVVFRYNVLSESMGSQLLLLKRFLVYHSLTSEAWKVPDRPVEVSGDVTLHLVAYQTAIETRTNSSGMHTHTGQHSRLLCMCTLSLA